MMKFMFTFIFGVMLINSVYPVTLFFFSVALSLGVLWEVGAHFSDFLSLLSFMVYISGITAVIGYFITFFPKKIGGGFPVPCVYSLAYMFASTVWAGFSFDSFYFGATLAGSTFSTIFSMCFYGYVLLFLAPALFIIMVAVVMMSKPERMTLRRW